MKHVWYYEFPLCKIGLAEDGAGISDLFFPSRGTPAGLTEEETPLLKAAAAQLAEYFAGQRRAFDLPLSLHGTPFQLRDWAALSTIPYGETRSYQQIAEQLGNPKACRAVGLANNRNPVSIIVPCHRVVGKNGKLVGYGGGLDVKTALLELERRVCEGLNG